jgi:Holliday junction resolvase RusA-like endonuclease
VDPFEFFVQGPPLSQQTRNPGKLREWKEYVRGEASKLWSSRALVETPLKLTVVYYHERQSVLIDHDNMLKPIQDALAGLVYGNDRQITDAQTQKQILTDDSGCDTCRRSTNVPSVAAGSSFISG